MGKRKIQKYKQRKNLNDKEYEIDESENISNIESLKNLQTILDILQSGDSKTREQITNFLSIHQFDIDDKNLINIVSSIPFIKTLTNMLNDNFYQVRYNAISALNNIIISFNIIDIENILLTKTNFIELSIMIIKDFSNVEKNNIEHINRIRTLKNLFDLYSLIIDLYSEDIQNKIKFDSIVEEILKIIIDKKELINDELLGNCLNFLGNIFSVEIITLTNESNYLKKFIEEGNKYINDNNTNEYIKTLYNYSLFYLCSTNNDFLKQNNIILLPKIIDFIYLKISSQNSLISLYSLGEDINKIAHDKMKIEDSNKDSTNNIDIKEKAKLVDKEVNSLLNCLKCFQDIIDSIEISNNVKNEEINMDDYEEIEDDIDDKNDIDIDKFEECIHKSITEIISINNFEPVQKMINQNLLNHLSTLCNIHSKINEFYINEVDKLLVIRTNLDEIEYDALSLINNIIIKFSNIPNKEFIESLYSFITSKLGTIIVNDNNNEILSLYILVLRTILDKFSGNFKNFPDDDYNNLLTLIIKTNDNFIKCNIIDIISLCSCADNKFEIGEKLKELFYNQNHIEVLSHVINAFMDLFKEDDLESNKYLKKIEIINIMKNGINEFKNRMKIAKKNKDIDKDEYEYIKETFINMKRFIKYKEDSFKQMNI